MATLSNINQISHNGKDVLLMKLNGIIVYEKIIEDRGYCVEYTINKNDLYGSLSDNINLFLPRIYSTNSSYDYNYDSIEITLLDGTVTTNTKTALQDISKITLWYPETTKSIKFHTTSSSSYHRIENVNYCKTDGFVNMDYMFYGCTSLTKLNLRKFNTSNVINMAYMFNNCNKLTSLDLNNFDTSNVTDMRNMFASCNLLTKLNLSKFNTSQVTDMQAMFSNCNKLTSLDLSNFDTSNVTNMRAMFFDCGYSKISQNIVFGLTGLSNWDTGKVTNMSRMFAYSNIQTLDISNWNMDNVTNTGLMFENCDIASLDISNWIMNDTINTDNMFMNCYALHTLHLDNCNNNTIRKIITSVGFPTDEIIDAYGTKTPRKIYCKRVNAAGLENLLPDPWQFSYID